MFSKTIVAAGLIAATTLAAVPANAHGLNIQFGFGSDVSGPAWNHGQNGRRDHRGPFWQHLRLSERDVQHILSRQGYRHVRVVDAQGPVYQVRAHRFGQSFFLIVSARDGSILARYQV